MTPTDDDPIGQPTRSDKLTPQLIRLAVAVMFGAFAVQLDATMVNVAFNTFLKDFNASLSAVQWVGTAYLLAMAMVIPLTGWAVERFGARTTWICSLCAFLLGSVLCGIAWSVPSLVAFRVVQGLGGGMIIPLAQTILAQAAGPARLGRVMAAVGVPAILGPVLGPELGGLIISDLSWRWIFYVNIPVCLIGVRAAMRTMSGGRAARSTPPKLDLLGLALLSPAVAALVYGLYEAGSSGDFTNARALVPLLAGAALALLFIAKTLRTRIEPILDLRLLRQRGFAASSALVLVSGVSLFGATVLLPLYFQQVRGYTPLHAGVLLIPQGIGLGLSLIISGGLSDKVNPRPTALVGLLLAAAGSLVSTSARPPACWSSASQWPYQAWASARHSSPCSPRRCAGCVPTRSPEPPPACGSSSNSAPPPASQCSWSCCNASPPARRQARRARPTPSPRPSGGPSPSPCSPASPRSSCHRRPRSKPVPGPRPRPLPPQSSEQWLDGPGQRDV
jgi:EmrB/QacA subfamily drug resistance transporter